MISVHEGCYSQSYISFCIFWHSLWLSTSNIWPNRQRLYEISFDFVRFDGESHNIFHNLVVLWLFENLKVFKIINIFLFSSSENHSQLFQLPDASPSPSKTPHTACSQNYLSSFQLSSPLNLCCNIFLNWLMFPLPGLPHAPDRTSRPDTSRAAAAATWRESQRC